MRNKTIGIAEFFDEVETVERHIGHTYSARDAIVIAVMGSVCGLKNLSQIHQWATSPRAAKFLAEQCGICDIPSYSWMLELFAIVKPESPSRCLANWVGSMLPEDKSATTVAIDGKTIRSTEKMKCHKVALQVVSAQLAEFGMTFGQRRVEEGGNEIPAARQLLGELQIAGCLVVADAMHCQSETAKEIVEAKADYLLNVKGNQKDLKEGLGDYVRDKVLRDTMDKASTLDKKRGRVERRTAYASCDVSWIPNKTKDENGADAQVWPRLACFGAIRRRVKSAKGESEEWAFYISSRKLDAKQLLHHARMEWTVETMHWFMDVHYGEDFFRAGEVNTQFNLSVIRKVALNITKKHKTDTGSKRPVSRIAFDCLLNPGQIQTIVAHMPEQTNHTPPNPPSNDGCHV